MFHIFLPVGHSLQLWTISHTPGPSTVEGRTKKLVGLRGSHLRPIPGEKVKLGSRASKCRKTDREALTWK